jgi:hypothetical protein
MNIRLRRHHSLQGRGRLFVIVGKVVVEWAVPDTEVGA